MTTEEILDKLVNSGRIVIVDKKWWDCQVKVYRTTQEIIYMYNKQK